MDGAVRCSVSPVVVGSSAVALRVGTPASDLVGGGLLGVALALWPLCLVGGRFGVCGPLRESPALRLLLILERGLGLGSLSSDSSSKSSKSFSLAGLALPELSLSPPLSLDTSAELSLSSLSDSSLALAWLA